MKFKFPFLDLLAKLGGDSTQLVLVGGWVPAVYFTYLWPDEYFLVTKDIDFGLDDKASLQPSFENKVGPEHFKRKHLNMGKMRPYQLIYENLPVDFLTSPQNLERAQKELVGADLLVNLSEDYEDLLCDTLSVDCDGIMVRVPQPARYLVHKICVYLENRSRRQRDIATAYYCLANSEFRKAVKGYLPSLVNSKETKLIKEKLPKFLGEGGFVAKDVHGIYSQYGRYESSEDIREKFQQLLSWID